MKNILNTLRTNKRGSQTAMTIKMNTKSPIERDNTGMTQDATKEAVDIAGRTIEEITEIEITGIETALKGMVVVEIEMVGTDTDPTEEMIGVEGMKEALSEETIEMVETTEKDEIVQETEIDMETVEEMLGLQGEKIKIEEGLDQGLERADTTGHQEALQGNLLLVKIETETEKTPWERES